MPPAPNPFLAAFGKVSGGRYFRAVIVALLAYAAAWLVGMVITVLVLIGASGQSTDWSWIFEAPGQLVAAAMGSTVTGSMSLLGISASLSALWLPLLITAVVVAGIVVLTRRDERVELSETRATRWILSLAAGLTFALFALLLAAVIPLVASSSTDDAVGALGFGAARLSVSGASVTGFLGALAIATLASYVARGKKSRPALPVSEFRTSVRTAATSLTLYSVTVGAILVVVLIVGAVVNSGAGSLWSIGLWLPTALVNAFALANLGTVTVSGSATSLPGFAQIPSSIWLPSTLPAWGTILVVVLNLVVIALIGAAISTRRSFGAPGQRRQWATTIIAFAVAGAAVSVVGSIALWTHVDATALGDSLSSLLGGSGGGAALSALGAQQLVIGPAAWTFIVFGILGAAMQASIVWVGPAVLRVLPDGFAVASSRVVDRVIRPSAQAVDESAQPHQDLSARAPMDPARRRRVRLIVWLVGGVIAIIVVVAVALSIIGQSLFSPQHEADKYLSSLVAKNAVTAKLVGHISDSGDGNSLLSSAVMKATTGGVSKYSIVSTTTSGDEASVVARLTQGTSTSSKTYQLHRTGSTWLFFSTWEMRPVVLPALVVDVSNGIKSLQINGTTVPVSDAASSDGEVHLSVFPGRYRVAVGGSSQYLSASPKTVVISAGDISPDAAVQLTVKPTQAFRDALTTQIGDFLKSCAADKSLAPKNCPFEYFGFGTTSSVHWTIKSVPKLTLDPSEDGTWTVDSEEPGDAVVTFNESFFGETSRETGDSSIYITGTVDLSSGTPVFTYKSLF